jgi:hypothetical protein
MKDKSIIPGIKTDEGAIKPRGFNLFAARRRNPTLCHPERFDSLWRVKAGINCRQLANSRFPRSGS